MAHCFICQSEIDDPPEGVGPPCPDCGAVTIAIVEDACLDDDGEGQ